MHYTQIEDKQRMNRMLFGQFTRVIIVLAAVALIGLGCKSEDLRPPPAQDERAQVPEGWQVYRNEKWRVEQLAYPKGWDSREEELIGGELTVFLPFTRAVYAQVQPAGFTSKARPFSLLKGS